MLVGTLRRGSGMTGSGGVAVPVVGSERFCRSDALNRVLSRLLGAGFGTGAVCAVESVATPATETATIKANAARVPASVNGSAGRNFVILVNARSWFASRAIVPRRKARRSGGATGRCANIDSFLNADWLNEGIRLVCSIADKGTPFSPMCGSRATPLAPYTGCIADEWDGRSRPIFAIFLFKEAWARFSVDE